MTDARLQGPDWAVTDLDLELAQHDPEQGDWQAGRTVIHERQRVYLRLAALFDPILNAEFPAGHCAASVHPPLGRGMVCTSGNWLREG